MDTKRIALIGGQAAQRRELADLLAQKYSIASILETQAVYNQKPSGFFTEEQNLLFFEDASLNTPADLFLLIENGWLPSNATSKEPRCFESAWDSLQKMGTACERIGGTADCLLTNALLACDAAFSIYNGFFFFVDPSEPFSQWYPSDFVAGGFAYNCAEQYMMHQKALLFGDMDAARHIMKTDIPAEHQAWGREVRGFDSRIWKQHCKYIVYKGNFAKFTQNAGLLDLLKNTQGKLLVEAYEPCPYWGAGLRKEDPKIIDRSQWKGKNWIGFILTRLREDI